MTDETRTVEQQFADAFAAMSRAVEAWAEQWRPVFEQMTRDLAKVTMPPLKLPSRTPVSEAYHAGMIRAYEAEEARRHG